jgi:hypothetical protein
MECESDPTGSPALVQHSTLYTSRESRRDVRDLARNAQRPPPHMLG